MDSIVIYSTYIYIYILLYNQKPLYNYGLSYLWGKPTMINIDLDNPPFKDHVPLLKNHMAFPRIYGSSFTSPGFMLVSSGRSVVPSVEDPSSTSPRQRLCLGWSVVAVVPLILSWEMLGFSDIAGMTSLAS